MKTRLIILVATMLIVAGTTPAQDAGHEHESKSTAKKTLAEQLAELRSKVAKLEAALKRQHSEASARAAQSPSMLSMKSEGKADSGMPMGGMGMMKGMGGNRMKKMKGMGGGAGMSMGGMGMMTGGMGGNSQEPMSMGRMGMTGGMGMKMMGTMSPPASARSSRLPGFPGISHIYHIGSTEMFLDHAEHLALTPKQRHDLGSLQEKTSLEQATLGRELAQEEQDLWVLTSHASPDARKIENKLKEIAALQVSRRMGFIRAVGKAAQTLTEEQRKLLLGEAHSHSPQDTTEHKNH